MNIDIQTTRDGQEFNKLKISARYSKGGINYANGNNERRGIYIHVHPVFSESRGNGIASESFMMFAKDGGFKLFVTPLKRLNTKKVEQTQRNINALEEHEVRSLFMATDGQSSDLANLLRSAAV